MLGEIKIYRMTHISNVPHILKHGITHKKSPNSNPNFVTIGDLSLIDTRNIKSVHINNGDLLNFNSPSIILGDFIPFYFGIKMPMLYVMQNGGNFVEKATIPKNIVYVVCSLIDIVNAEINYYFTDGHATDNLTSFYDKTKVDSLPIIIDWNAVKAPFWGGQDNLNIKRKKQAEFLIKDDLSPRFIVGFGCFNEIAKQELMDMGIADTKIKQIPNAYF